jgi:hypothetical protein
MAGNDKLNVFGMKIQKLVGIVNGRLKTWKKRKMELSKELEENTVFIEEIHSGLCELAGDM